jgi:hypothetical protein
MAQRYNNSAGHTNKSFVYAVMQGLCGLATEKSGCAKMAGRTILQMAQATYKDKEVLGYDGECCTYTNQCGYYHILSRGYCPT